jgi:hypothetical protein
MNDDTDKPLNPVGDDALEARITAWVLGEASPFEAAELEEICARDPEARLFERRLRVLHGFIVEDRKAGADDEWKLPAEKRAKIEALFEEPVVLRGEDHEAEKVGIRYVRKPVSPRETSRRALLALAACTVISAAGWMLFSAVGESSKEAVAMQADANGSAKRANQEDQQRYLEELRKAVLVQEDAVEDKRKLLSQIERTEGILYSGNQAARGFGKADNVQSAAEAHADLEKERVNLESQLAALDQATATPQTNYASGWVIPDDALAAKVPQLQEEKRQFDSLRSQGLAESHPEVKAKAAKLEGMEKDVKESVAQVRETLKAKLALSNEQLARLERRANSKEDDAVKQGIANQNFVDVKNDFETSQRLLEGLKIKLLSEEMRTKASGDNTALASADKQESLPAGGAGGGFGGGLGAGAPADLFARSAPASPAAPPAPAAKPAAPVDSLAAIERKSENAAAADESLAQLGEKPAARRSKSSGLPSVTTRSEPQLAGKPMQAQAEGTPLDTGSSFGAEADSVAGILAGGTRGQGAASGSDFDQRLDAPGNVPADSGAEIADLTGGFGNKDVAQAANGYVGQSLRFHSQLNGAQSMDGFADRAAGTPEKDSSEWFGYYSRMDGAKSTATDFKNLQEVSKLAESPPASVSDFDRPSMLGGLLHRAPEEGGHFSKDADRFFAMGRNQTEADQAAGADGAVALGKEAVSPTAATAAPALQPPAESAPLLTDLGKEVMKAKKSAGSAMREEAENNPLSLADSAGTPKALVPQLEEAIREEEEKLQRDPNSTEIQDQLRQLAKVRDDLRGKVDAKAKDDKMQEQDKAPVPVALAETLTSAEPFSTFSLHVSDASFKLAKAALDRGEVPAADSIRPEEFYNAFDFGDPAPAAGEPVVCAVEQSAHPALPQRNLLRIGVKTGSQGRGGSTPLNLTLLLDSSGSMEREDRSSGLANAVRQLSGLLKEGDTVSVIGFARQPRLLVDRLPGNRAQELNAIFAQTPSEGGTNLEEGLKLGEELALRQFNAAAQNRIVLFTDGAANLGDAKPETLQAKVEQMRQNGIAFDAAGFGTDGLNDKLLERMTRNGNGRYYIVDRAEDADASFAKQLAGAFRPAAENVKVQVRFNPARVAKYKLIGFEEHRLKKEDFRNDAVDAAEMAAEEAGNALYQIEALPQGEGEVGEVSVRFRDVASGQMVERTWTIPYEAQAASFDKATPSIQLAGLAAFAAEKLRGAPMADAVDFQQLAPVMAKVRARYANSKPVAELESMIGKLK